VAESKKEKNIRETRIETTLKFILVVALFFAGVKLFMVSPNAANDLETKHKDSSISREDFAKCLNEKGLIMYGDDTCDHCLAQKKMFGTSFENINYVNCYFDKDKCDAQGITGYPTWVMGDQKISGVQKFANLAAISGCSAPIEE